MNLYCFELNRKRWVVRLMLTTGVALLFVLALLWGIPTSASALSVPGILYVDGATGSDDSDCSDPGDPCATIGYALSQAANGDEIWVAGGTYLETLNVAITVTFKGGYTLSGGAWLPGTGQTVVDANGADDNVIEITPNSNVMVEGFTIQGANHTSGEGGGFFINGATVVISDTVVQNNTAGTWGGGVYVEESTGAAIVSIINSTLLENTAMGAGGGAISAGDTSLSIFNSQVMTNTAPNGQSGGIDVRPGSTVDVLDSIIAYNTTKNHGGAATVDPSATLNMTNTLIIRNSTTSDNANVLGVNSDVTMMNCTIGDNNPQGAQGIILWSGHLTITNSILWNNALNLQSDPSCPTCFAVSYSDVENGWTGTGNLDTDPFFAGGSDYHLQVNSPCIDKGTATGAPTHDIDGMPRGALPDMGAYEWTGARFFLPLAFKNYEP